ncbi:MAG: hypothetical protein R3301_00415, partial [Saprospiraceae bacterium]|nr:hypothetical protein [Saprospiraceae bacterium]
MQAETETMPRVPDSLFAQLDPCQIRAVKAAHQEGNAWIYGRDQVKQRQVLIQLMLDNTAQGKSTLVCAGPEWRTAIIEELKSLGIEHFAMALRAPSPPTVLAALQVARKKNSNEDTLTQCDLAINRYHTWLHTQLDPYRALERPLFGEMTWKQLVDQTATAPRDTFKSQLAAALVTSDFVLDQKEYWHIKGRIRTFQRLRVLRTPAFDVLDHLHDSIFEQADNDQVRRALTDRLTHIMQTGRGLLRQIGELVHQYRRDITGAQHEALETLKGRIHDIETLLVSGEMQFGPEFYAESTFNDFTDRIRRSVSRKSRAMHGMRGDIREAYRALIDDIRAISVLSEEMEGQLIDEPLTMEFVAEGLSVCKALLIRWSEQIDAEATDHKRRLNAQNIPQGHVLRQMIREVEEAIQTYVEDVNGQQVFAAQVEVNALSLEKRSLVIKDVVTRCMKVQEAMADFEAYFLWRSFWFQLEDNVRTLLEGLDIMDDVDQMHAFEAWYFENVLDQIPAARIAARRIDQKAYEERLGEMRAVV